MITNYPRFVVCRERGAGNFLSPWLLSDSSQQQRMSTGWPLGLEIMSAGLRVSERSQGVRLPTPAPAAEPYSIHVRAISFSSFSSSDLDTESTASFFHDSSVSLGRLIGIRAAGNGRCLYFPDGIHLEDHQRSTFRRTSSDLSKGHGHGNCIPLLLKMNIVRSRNKSRHQPE